MNERFEELVKHILDGGLFLEQAVEALEKTVIGRALERSQGNQCKAAKALGIHRNTLQRKMVTYELGVRRKRRKPVARAVNRSKSKRKAS